MATEFHVRARDILEAAVTKATVDRDDFLAESVGRDTGLLREIQSLLPHYLSIAGFEPKPLISNGSRSPEGKWSCGLQGRDPEEDEWEVPFAIAPFRVTHMIGRGGMGVVYQGVHSTRPQQVAIKILRRRFLERGFIRFKQEEELLRRLQHPGIVRFLFGGEVVMRKSPDRPIEDRRPYIVMEHIQGQSLVKYAAAHSLDVLQRLDLLILICDAVEYAHHRGVVHCDLKPDNILVDAAGQPRILDFGIARLQHFGAPLATDARNFAGTFAYASPEQRTPGDRAMSPESDVYSLGLITHELLTGKLPKRGGGRLVLGIQDLQGCRAIPPSDVRELQHVLRVMIATALRGTRGKRYVTAGELGQDLAEVRRAFSPQPAKSLSLSSWIAGFWKEPNSASTVHSRLLCTLLRTRIGMGIDI